MSPLRCLPGSGVHLTRPINYNLSNRPSRFFGRVCVYAAESCAKERHAGRSLRLSMSFFVGNGLCAVPFFTVFYRSFSISLSP